MNREQLRKAQVFKMTALGALALLALLGYIKMNANAAAMRAASQGVSECHQLVREIAELQELPQFAALQADTPKTIGQRIEQASTTARLPAGSLIRIAPQSPQRLGNSQYQLRPTRLELANVTLQQIATFGHALVDEQRGLTVRDLRLWTTANESTADNPETWSAEFTLTQVTFVPMGR